MIPLRDSTRSRKYPLVTIILIALNIYIYVRQFTSAPSGLQHIIANYAFIPAHYSEQIQELSVFGLFFPPLITSIFLHGSWFHVLSNMLYLWIFGDNIEDRLGHARFVAFYLLAGIVANLAHFLIDPHSPIPLVGASGAVAGVLGAYFITFPRARITSLVFILFFITVREIPAVFFLLFWFIIQVFNGINSLGGIGGNVAWWAHIGGFLTGMVLVNLLKRKNTWNPS
jgi:membrane associated rhomboid family serine protease